MRGFGFMCHFLVFKGWIKAKASKFSLGTNYLWHVPKLLVLKDGFKVENNGIKMNSGHVPWFLALKGVEGCARAPGWD
jgi:hypothetical protein